MSDIYIHRDGRIEMRQPMSLGSPLVAESIFLGFVKDGEGPPAVNAPVRYWKLVATVHGVQIFEEV